MVYSRKGQVSTETQGVLYNYLEGEFGKMSRDFLSVRGFYFTFVVQLYSLKRNKISAAKSR